MLHRSPLHAHAASRGDGLRQELLELFASREALGAANVESIASHVAEHMSQAGPNPVGELDSSNPQVLLFPHPRPAQTPAIPSPDQR